jgi:hypothetical protein
MNDAVSTVYRRYEVWTSVVRRIFFWRHRAFAAVQIERLPESLTDELFAKARNNAVALSFSVTDAFENYQAGALPEAVAEAVRTNFSFFRISADPGGPLARAVRQIGQFATASLGHPVKVVNVRMWSTPSSSGKEAGANTWHRDGFPDGVLKIMTYLTPPSREAGTTEIQLEDGNSLVLEGPAGTIMLFDNSKLLHRGVPPTGQRPDRLIMEVTIIPALFSRFAPVFAGLNAQFPNYPWR